MTKYKECNENRVIYLDAIRIVATFGVIALHVFALNYYSTVGSYSWFIAVIGDSLVRWAVPLFVMLSGTLFLQPTKEISYHILFKKYIPRLLFAYIFWSLCYSTTTLIGYIIIGKELKLSLLIPHFHLWYLPMLIGIYLLIPIIQKISIDNNLTRSSLILWFLYLLGCFCNFDKIPQVGIFFNINSIIGYAGYFLLGFYVSNYNITKKQSRYIYFIGICGAITCVCGNILTSYLIGTSNGKFLNNLGPAVIAMSLALFTFIKQLTPKIKNNSVTFIKYVQKDLFGIYLTHGFWLFILSRPFFRNMCNELITLPIIIILIFILSLYTTKLIRRIPLLKKIIE